MNLGFKLNNHQKSNLAQIIALILTTIILFTITLGIYKILNPQKIVKVIPHLHLKTNESMIYEFSIKRFNKADTIFITQNKKRFFSLAVQAILKPFVVSNN